MAQSWFFFAKILLYFFDYGKAVFLFCVKSPKKFEDLLIISILSQKFSTQLTLPSKKNNQTKLLIKTKFPHKIIRIFYKIQANFSP